MFSFQTFSALQEEKVSNHFAVSLLLLDSMQWQMRALKIKELYSVLL